MDITIIYCPNDHSASGQNLLEYIRVGFLLIYFILPVNILESLVSGWNLWAWLGIFLLLSIFLCRETLTVI